MGWGDADGAGGDEAARLSNSSKPHQIMTVRGWMEGVGDYGRSPRARSAGLVAGLGRPCDKRVEARGRREEVTAIFSVPLLLLPPPHNLLISRRLVLSVYIYIYIYIYTYTYVCISLSLSIHWKEKKND